MSARWAPPGALFAVAALASPAAAHGFGERYDLPVPLSLWIGGAALVVTLSFVVIGLFARGTAGTGSYPRIDLLHWRPMHVLVDPGAWRAGRVLAVALLVLVILAGVVGTQNPTRNIAPAAVWVLWWVGVAHLCAFVANVWSIVNPWSALYALVARSLERPDRLVAYPRALGVWPAVALLGVFSWIALVFDGRAIPAELTLLVLGYSVITWGGMAVFGPSAWLRHGDPFVVAFALLARFAPTELRVTDTSRCRACAEECGGRDGCVNCVDCFTRAAPAERELNLRPFAAGLLRAERVSPSMQAFVLVLLASVTFDGFMATPPWSAIERALYALAPGEPDLRLTLVETAGLIGLGAFLLVTYRLFAAAVALATGRSSASRAGALFVPALVPIALAYRVAHDVPSVVAQVPLLLPLASDPLGLGWDLFGTAGAHPDLGILDAGIVWYVAVAAIVAGHIVAVSVAHAIARREFGDSPAVLRSQLVMLVLMVACSTTSLWIVAQPLIEFGGTG